MNELYEVLWGLYFKTEKHLAVTYAVQSNDVKF